MINPQWLRSFTAVSRTGSFTRAADELDLTQAAVSQHIKSLEAELGPLFVRRPRNIDLTPAAVALLEYCDEINRADNRLHNRLTDGQQTCGDFTIITPGSIGLFLYPRLLSLQEANHNLVIRHRFAPDPEILQAVLENRYEVGLTTVRPDDPRLSVSHFTEENLELIVPAEAKVNEWADLEALGLIDHPDGKAMAKRLLGQMFPKNRGLNRMPVRGFSNQVALILEPVARGLGFTVLPQYARQVFRDQKRIRVIRAKFPVIDTIWLIHRSEWPLSARADYVISKLRGIEMRQDGAE
ncbi:LysR family transcriptional regulator [Thalassospira lucentensis]|uniref:LysR family transcriptional regulator n=1 Tax=Thalassospira lucentensis TaxID=168935 RepID=UPI003D2EAF9A